MRSLLGVAAAIVVIAAACNSRPTVIPDTMMRDWRSIGMECSAATVDDLPGGLQQWSCVGLLGHTVVHATLDAHDSAVRSMLVQVSAEVERAEAITAIQELTGATEALGADRAPINDWLGGDDLATESPDVDGLRVVFTADPSYFTLVVTWPD